MSFLAVGVAGKECIERGESPLDLAPPHPINPIHTICRYYVSGRPHVLFISQLEPHQTDTINSFHYQLQKTDSLQRARWSAVPRPPPPPPVAHKLQQPHLLSRRYYLLNQVRELRVLHTRGTKNFTTSLFTMHTILDQFF